MMESYNEYSNAQLRRKIDEIKNEYDSTKEKIDELCTHMEKLEKEYSSIMNIIECRKTID